MTSKVGVLVIPLGLLGGRKDFGLFSGEGGGADAEEKNVFPVFTKGCELSTTAVIVGFRKN
jgi:hypothetical protein